MSDIVQVKSILNYCKIVLDIRCSMMMLYLFGRKARKDR